MPAAQRPFALLLALVLLLAGAAALRCHPAVITTTATGIDFVDADTVRRLVRLHSVDAAGHYPVVEVRDGFPAGAVLQWTLPMDLVIRTLDAVAPRLHPGARPYESGAALAGPLLGTLAVLAFALLACRLLPPGQAALAALLYAISAPGIEVTRLGNGDHQSLQLLCIAIAVPGCLVLLAGRGGRGLAVLAGAALGLSLWVNAESMLALVIDGLMIVVGLSLCDRATALARLALLLPFAIASAAVAVLGQLVEHRGALLLEWDRISCFQSGAALGLVACVLLARALLARGLRPAAGLPLAAGIAGLLVAGPFLLVPSLRDALAAELFRAATFAGFCAACVAEYRPLFADGIGLAWLVYGPTLWLIPVCTLGLAGAVDLPRHLRWCLLIPTVLLGGLVLDQVKLAHMFAIPWALILPAGGAGALHWLARVGRIPPAALPRLRLAAGLGLAALALWHILQQTFTPVAADHSARRAVVAAVRELQFSPPNPIAAERTAVMAPWELGHHLLYETDKPIVASSYQRRVDGIRDSFAALCSRDPAEARAILQRRGVRWLVRPGDPSFLLLYHRVVPDGAPLGHAEAGPDGPRIGLHPAVRQTLWARTAAGAELPDWLQPVFDTPQQGTWWGSFAGPAFRVFRVRYSDEPE